VRNASPCHQWSSQHSWHPWQGATYSGKTLANYFYGLHAWHILHGVKWSVNEDEMDTLLKAAKNLMPASSKWKEHLPFTCATLEKILLQDAP